MTRQKARTHNTIFFIRFIFFPPYISYPKNFFGSFPFVSLRIRGAWETGKIGNGFGNKKLRQLMLTAAAVFLQSA
jgi:hypothetical protein